MTIDLNRRTLLGALPFAALGLSAAHADGLIERRESQYNTIYITRDGPYVAMQFGVNDQLFTENLYDPARPRFLPMEYTRMMTVSLAYAATPAKVLEIGLGGGRTAVYLTDFVPTLSVTAVELDPEVVAMAAKHFDVRPKPRLNVVTSDGRIFLTQTRERYDIIIVDAYRGTFVPFHLTTQQFFILAKRRLNPGGVVVQNIAPNVLLTESMVATLQSVFDNVDTFDIAGSVIALAYDGPAKPSAALTARATALQNQYRFTHPLPQLVRSRRTPAKSARRPLTDDFAPVEHLRGIQAHNARRK
jgi:spermidine synthase